MVIWLVLLMVATNLPAQRVFERDGDVIYVGSSGRDVDVGLGFSPVLTHDGKVAFLSGRFFHYGDKFDCAHKATKNWVSVFDPVIHSQRVLFDRTLRFGLDFDICVFSQMQLSPDDSILYLVTNQWSATGGSLAIIRLRGDSMTYVAGVNEVYVVESGPDRGDLVYERRMWDNTPYNEHPYYSWVHARANGTKVKILADEPLLTTGAPDTDAPKLKAYLQRIGGRIIINVRFPDGRSRLRVILQMTGGYGRVELD
jgi:hypothetical protein